MTDNESDNITALFNLCEFNQSNAFSIATASAVYIEQCDGSLIFKDSLLCGM